MKIWFKIIGLLILFVGSEFALQMIIGFYFALFGGEFTDETIVDMTLLSDIVFCFIAIGFILWRRRRLTEPCHFTKPKSSVLLITVPLAVCLNLFLVFFLPFLPLDESAKQMEEMFQPFLDAPLWKEILIIVVFAAINEELMLRGLIFHELRRKMPIIVAIVIQGILFGLIHFNLLQIVYAAPMGILLGYIYVWTRSIWVTMSIHLFNNLTATLLDEYVNQEIAGSILYSVCFFVLALVFTVWLYRLQFADRTVATKTKEYEGANV